DQFAGWFLGNPGMAFFDAELHGAGGFLTLVSPMLPAPTAIEGYGLSAGPVTIGIRPEQILVSVDAEPGSIPATLLRKSIQIGGQYLLTLALPGSDEPFRAKVAHDAGG